MHVLAVHPVAQTGTLNTKSYVDSDKAKPLNKAMIEWFVDKLLAKPDDKKDPRLDLVDADGFRATAAGNRISRRQSEKARLK